MGVAQVGASASKEADQNRPAEEGAIELSARAQPKPRVDESAQSSADVQQHPPQQVTQLELLADYVDIVQYDMLRASLLLGRTTYAPFPSVCTK